MSTKTEIAAKLVEALNRHGYVFQHRVLKEAEDNFDERISTTWLFEASEFPVKAGHQDTRIDFLLKARRTSMVIVGECKRANPALSHWCFAKAPYVGREIRGNVFIAEYVRPVDGALVSTGAVFRHLQSDSYHVALPVKSDQKGDFRGGPEDAIEVAASQVCRGVNGLVETYAQCPPLLGEKKNAVVVPVVFTTATLWATDVSFKDADIVSGTLRPEQVDVEEKEWVYYQYHQSPGLKHTVGRSRAVSYNSLSSWMEADSIRTIIIVNASASKKFLAHFGDDMHGLQPM